MYLLPKGKPLHENLSLAKTNVPEILGKLKENQFTGYVSFKLPSAVGVILFESGKLISATVEQGTKKIAGFEAMAALFGHVLADGGSVSVYQLSNDLTMCIHALLHGDVLYKGQELKLIDVKGLVEKMKARRLNGCLCIYTTEKTALIFYKDGAPLGFFHDGSEDIETSASESQKIAGLPGAKLDVLSTKSVDELMHFDLLEMVNVEKLWETALLRHSASIEKMEKESSEREKKQQDDQLRALEEDLKEIAVAYAGKLGKTLVEKELQEQGGRKCLLDPKGAANFLLGVERASKLLISLSKLDEMLRLMRSEISKLVRI